MIPTTTKENLGPNHIAIADFRKIHDLKSSTFQVDYESGVYASIVKVIPENRLYIDKNEKPRMPRAHKEKLDSKGRSKIRLRSDASYAETQEAIYARGLVSENIRPFITKIEEANYYRNNNYREVEIQGKAALICDIYPDYYIPEMGMTNRERILHKQSPVVPPFITEKLHATEYAANCTLFSVYDLHHIGQTANSPYAIIPSFDHKGRLDKTFHPNPNAKVLHGPDYEIEKQDFYLKLLELYDDYGGYQQIPHRLARERGKSNRKR